ncbi:DUF418 domain-containing protein [Carboxylicivirga mesophila]|uniref:DUF418 domain-containing protein n=1 Tax=Carboxylicivirga mesophila TaxID=1166478 RepID=A0ABS5KBN8_9BACT|nr:DUF418 domain-containing protein [Carboxylicivirga mesophila]MBS2212351.1 DUF418 domain-containing protein [Carboxylicivirga mesophila]
MSSLFQKRIDLVDSLRGFSLFGILLIHFIEHFNLYFYQSPPLEPFKALNTGIWETTFYIFSGKAYAIFSFLFGFSFFIQFNNQKKQGYDFRIRFAWRMILLMVFAQLNAMFYPGDILVLYSFVGLVLIILSNASNQLVYWVAILFMLQPLEWYQFFSSIIDIDYQPYEKINWNYFKLVSPVLASGTLPAVWKTNLWEGQIFSNLWQIENGRLFQTASLFLLGMLSGRKELFHKTPMTILFWRKVLACGLVGYGVLYSLQFYLQSSTALPSKILLSILVPTLKNFFFGSVLVAAYTLLWYTFTNNRLQSIFIAYGRMSLTNYISMAIIGSFIFYGYGLSLNTTLNIVFSFIAAILVFIVQLLFSIWWLKKYKQGPLEYLWKKLTWMGDSRTQLTEP